MSKKHDSRVVRLDWRTYSELEECKKRTGVPMAKQVSFHVLGKPAKVKRVSDC